MTHRSGALILWIVKGKLLDAKHISMTRYEDEAFDSGIGHLLHPSGIEDDIGALMRGLSLISFDSFSIGSIWRFKLP